MHIWAVGGGKGGTGKSLVSHGLSARLAERGFNVILVDTDYGGPNQHTYCGIRKPTTSLAQFFEAHTPLEELMMKTKIEGLHLIPGNFNSQNTDSLTSTQKQKLFRHIKKLPADHVILDLGAGTQYDTLDTFLLADIQVCVIAPDTLALENFYLFLKNLRFRQLNNTLSALGLRERAKTIWKDRAEFEISTGDQFARHLMGLFPDFAQMFDQEQKRLKPHIILNQVREYRQAEIGLAVSSAASKAFKLFASFAGHIRYEKDLWLRLGQDVPVIHPGVPFNLRQDLEKITDDILLSHRSEIT